MESRWNDADANAAAHGSADPDLGLRVYTSRLLGSEPSLILHGGGNTSVKSTFTDVFGDTHVVLWVKGSGSDLAQVGARDFAAVRLDDARRLIELETLDGERMAAALAAMCVAPGPRASIETVLHAILPARFVEHTHADAILALGNTEHGPARIGEVFGNLAPLVPFHASGFELAKACHAVYRTQATARTIGLILHHHGVFAFGENARESYENMLRLVTRAEAALQERGAWTLPCASTADTLDRMRVAALRDEISRRAGFPLLLEQQREPLFAAFRAHPSLAALSAAGPATPQHAVFIKREPMLGLDVDAYARRYAMQVKTIHPSASLESLGLDPAPRALFDAQLGVWVAAIDAHYLRLTREILRQDVEIKARASAHDRYVGLPLADLLHAEIHYGGFERKLRAAGLPLLGESAAIVLDRTAAVTPDIAALIAALAADGAAVSLVDAHGRLCTAGAQADGARIAEDRMGTAGLAMSSGIDAAGQSNAGDAVNYAQALDTALDEIVRRFGGIDVAILVGAAAALPALRPLLAHAPRGGRVVLLDTARDAAAPSDDSLAVARAVGMPARGLSTEQARLVTRLCTPNIAQQRPCLEFTSSR